MGMTVGCPSAFKTVFRMPEAPSMFVMMLPSRTHEIKCGR